MEHYTFGPKSEKNNTSKMMMLKYKACHLKFGKYSKWKCCE